MSQACARHASNPDWTPIAERGAPRIASRVSRRIRIAAAVKSRPFCAGCVFVAGSVPVCMYVYRENVNMYGSSVYHIVSCCVRKYAALAVFDA